MHYDRIAEEISHCNSLNAMFDLGEENPVGIFVGTLDRKPSHAVAERQAREWLYWRDNSTLYRSIALGSRGTRRNC